jgi:hypothetical protein
MPDSPHEPESVADAPLVGFDVFLPDRRIYGWIRLEAARLTDVLNADPEFALMNVQVERLANGRVESHEGIIVRRDGILAVRAGGPRGDPARRQELRRHPVVVQSGPFLIGGYLHAHHGVEPFDEIAARPVMIPLSDAWLEHWIDGRRGEQWVGTILFNQDLATTIRLVTEADLDFGMTSYPLGTSNLPARPDDPIRDAEPADD